jgi:polyhydroxyalkanoate synthesis repressor PhaR
MSDNRGPNPVLINKYPNRRYYDTLNSRHVTIQEVHDLIISGKDVCVTDTRTGEDLTNVVLMQILLERDHLKLDLFPSSIMHMMIRSSRNTLRTTLERFFGPFLGIMAASQKQFDSYLRETMKGQMMSPLDWTNGMFRALGAEGAPYARSSDHDSGPQPPASGEPASAEANELDELRAQLELLRRRVSDLDTHPPRKPRKKRPVRSPKSRK